MKYSEIIQENEKVAHDNGERELVTWADVSAFCGSDNTFGEVVETLMDMANGIYSAEDFVKDVREYRG